MLEFLDKQFDEDAVDNAYSVCFSWACMERTKEM